MAIICDSYSEVQLSKENFLEIRWATGGLVDGLPEECFTPGSSLPIGLKEQPLWYVKMKRPVTGWVAMYQL